MGPWQKEDTVVVTDPTLVRTIITDRRVWGGRPSNGVMLDHLGFTGGVSFYGSEHPQFKGEKMYCCTPRESWLSHPAAAQLTWGACGCLLPPHG